MRNALLFPAIFSLIAGFVFPASAQTASGDEPASVASAPISSPTAAVQGRLGIGYFTRDAPLGARYWITPHWAIDAGLKFAVASGGSGGQTYGIESGVVYALANFHYAVVIARGGLGFVYTDTAGASTPIPSDWRVTGSAFAGAEMFLGALGFPNVSLQAGVGLEASYRRVGSGGGTFLIGTTEGTFNLLSAGVLGFHIYL